MSQITLENEIEGIENKGFLTRLGNRINRKYRWLVYISTLAAFFAAVKYSTPDNKNGSLFDLLTSTAYAEETNKAYIKQISPVDGTDTHYIEQIGDTNVIRLEQIAHTGNNVANIKQEGNGNYVGGAGMDDSGHPSVDSGTEARQEGSDNFLEIVQIGNYNEVGLHQQSAHGRNEARLKQTGSYNIIAVIQESAGDNYANITQIGNRQIARIYQVSPSGDSVIVISQTAR